MAPWSAVASQRPSATVPETMGQRNTPWECTLLECSRSSHEKHCLDTGMEQIEAPTPRPMLYGTRDNTDWTSMCKTPIMPDQQWLNQFRESAEAQRRESERRYNLHKKYGSMTLFRKNQYMCEKTY